MTRIGGGRWRSKIEGFFFSPVNGNALAWFRILIAATYPYFFWNRSNSYSFLPENVTWLYENLIRTDGYRFVIVLLCAFLAFGWRARFFSFALLLVLAPMALAPIGRVSRPMFLFALLAFSFTPSGRVRLPRLTKGDEGFLPAGPCWPIRLIQIQLTLIYGVNAVAKTTPMFLSGEALMDMSVYFRNFLADFSTGYFTLGFLVIPVGLAALIAVLSEYFLAVGFWFRRCKWIAGSYGLFFHWVLTHVVHIFLLHFASIFLYLAFLLPLIPRQESRVKAE